MVHREKAAALWSTLLGEATKAGLQGEGELSEALDRSRSYLNTLKRRSGHPSLEDAVGVMAALPEPEWCLLGRLFPPPAIGSDLLRSLQLRAADAGPASSPAASLGDAFPGFGEAWRKVVALPIDPGADPGSSFRSRLDWLDEVRAERPAEARQSLEEICLQLLLHNANRTSIHPLALGEMGVALALWGSLRLGDCRAVAVEAHALGLELAERSNEEWCLGQGHWRAGALLHELGHPNQALQLLHLAGFYFGLGGHTLAAVRLLGSNAAILFDLGRFEQCEALYQRQLRCLPPSATRHRFLALSSLAQLAHRAGRVAEALQYLEAAELQEWRQGPAHARLYWKKAALQFECGDVVRGARSLGMAIEALATLGANHDIVFALADLVQYHEALGQGAALRAIAAEVGACLGKVRGKLRCLLEDFVAAHHLPSGLPAGFFRKESEKLRRGGARPSVQTFGPGGLEAALHRQAPQPTDPAQTRRRRARRARNAQVRKGA